MAEGPLIFISVAEHSADVHAARLAAALRTRLPGVRLRGLTGPRLRAVGVETVFDFAAHAAMIGGILKVLGPARRALRAAEASWRELRPDLVIVMDSSALHLRMAKAAKRAGLPVLYYIAPQTWASRPWRNAQIRKYVDRVACILPFEQDYFRSVGVDAEFVGHPLFETLADEQADPTRVAALRGDGHAPLVALLPGSRKHVIETMLPLQLDVVRQLNRRHPAAPTGKQSLLSAPRSDDKDSQAAPAARDGHDDSPKVRCAVSCVDGDGETLVRAVIERDASTSAGRTGQATAQTGARVAHGAGAGSQNAVSEVDLVVGDNASLLAAADLVLVASGTATLHVAAYRKPMIVMYDAGGWLRRPYRLFGRFLINLPNLSLVNILAGQRVAPEFMPFVTDTAPIADVAAQLLTDSVWRDVMVRQLDELVTPLERSDASRRVADLAASLVTRA